MQAQVRTVELKPHDHIQQQKAAIDQVPPARA